MTNEKFAAMVGVHFTMVSKIRNGERLPSGRLFGRIVSVFDLDPGEALTAYNQGPVTFGEFVDSAVFGRVAA
jgi:transcriptional regulator with XRE-family HTH domain